MKWLFSTSRTIHHQRPMWMAGLLLLVFSLVSCGGASQSTTVPTPTSATNGYTTFHLGLPAEALNAPTKGPLPDDTPMHVAVTFKTNQAVLDKLKKSGKGTNLEQSANQLGISDETYQKIKDLFGVTNATLKLDGLHTYLTIDGKAKTFAQAFQTSFVLHSLNGRTFYTPTSDPKLPNFIAPQVLAISGLDNYSLPPQPHSFLRGQHSALLAQNRKAQDNCGSGSMSAAPLQAAAHAYGYDQFWKNGWHGEGMTVNLIELGPYLPGDIQNFGNCVQWKGQLKTVDVGGPPDPIDQANPSIVGEVELDIEMVQVMAPAAAIVDYQTAVNGVADPWTRFNDELRQIIKDNEKSTPAGSVVSISYGTYEGRFSDSERAAIDQSMQILTEGEGMSVFVASADCAAFDTEQYGTLTVDYPGVSPWAVDVGGTRLTTDQAGNRVDEIPWSNGSDKTKCGNQWGSAGGISTIYPRPDWQKADGVDNKYSNGHRQVPDISAIAIDFANYFNGQWIPDGGTSAAAPIWASGMVLVNQGLIQQNQPYFAGPATFYSAADNPQDQHPFFDVTKGDNLYYQATPGWDYATGLGTPNLVDFYNVLLALGKQS